MPITRAVMPILLSQLSPNFSSKLVALRGMAGLGGVKGPEFGALARAAKVFTGCEVLSGTPKFGGNCAISGSVAAAAGATMSAAGGTTASATGGSAFCSGVTAAGCGGVGAATSVDAGAVDLDAASSTA